MSGPRILGDVNKYSDLHEIMRARADELGLTREHIDELAGLHSGYAAKLLSPKPIKKLGDLLLGLMMPGLGMRLVAIEDLDALERITRRGLRREFATDMHAGTVHIQFSRKFMRKIQRKGGANSRKYLTKRKASALGRRAAKARWRKPTLIEITEKAKGN